MKRDPALSTSAGAIVEFRCGVMLASHTQVLTKLDYSGARRASGT
jgi:hypothetical protein